MLSCEKEMQQANTKQVRKIRNENSIKEVNPIAMQICLWILLLVTLSPPPLFISVCSTLPTDFSQHLLVFVDIAW